MNKDSKIYVAGHRGLVGSAIVKRLKEEDYNNIITKKHKELDLLNQEETTEFFQAEKPAYVFLAAAKVGGILANNTYKADFIYDNIMIAANVIKASYKSGVKKLLNLGSSCIYPKHSPQPMKEEHLLSGYLEPTNEPYAIAKISAIKMCRYFNEQYRTNFISLMPTNLYGLNDNFHLINSHVLPALIRKIHLSKLLKNNDMEGIKKDFALWKDIENYNDETEIMEYLKKQSIEGDKLTLWGTGKPYREFLYVDDLADACVYFMNKYDYNDIGEIVNVGTGKDITIKELAFLIKDIIGYDGEILFDSTKPDGTPRKLLDVSRLNSLGWRAKTSLKEGINKVYDWYIKLV
jgi:GDP-L-fucose synthase